MKLLVFYGASLKLRDDEQYTPLHYGILYGTGIGLETII
jgi:hypothetical protein